jgi:hypothetical protein
VNNFLNGNPKAEYLRETMNKWDCIKIKGFCKQKKQTPDSMDNPQYWRKSLPATHLTKV